MLGNEIARFLDGSRPKASVRLRLLAGASVGAVFAAFTPILALIWAVKGPVFVDRNGVRLRVDVLTFAYPLGAVLSGALFSLLVSYCRSRLVGALAGAAALTPWFALVVAATDDGLAAWTRAHTVTVLVGAGVIGGWLGWFAVHMQRRTSRAAA